ncbi:MAG: VOC family protein, partial [Pseudomonadota bacterium]
TNILMDISSKHTGYTHVALEVSDLNAAAKTVEQADIKITERVELPDGTAFFFVRDPDNNVIEFHQPANTNQENT